MPHPDPERLCLSLDGIWRFTHEIDGRQRDIVVPMPWQAQFDDLRQVSGTAHYRRSFPAPPANPDEHWLLCFGAVGYHTTVRLNGIPIGSHEGGWLPFECPIPDGLLHDENQLDVTVILPDGSTATPDFPFAEIPHGKQSWYGPTGGIWQSVRLERRNRFHLQHCAITADLATGQVALALTLTGPTAEGTTVAVTLLAPDGSAVATSQTGTAIATGQTDAGTLTLTVPQVQPWHPDHPALYTARVTLLQAGQPKDITNHSFGFRSFQTRNGQLLLNGAPFYMRAALDQDYYPTGICNPPSLEFLEDQLHKAKALGLNMLRCHIKVPDPRYYEAADRLGMLIWTEIPNVAGFTAASARRMRDTMQGILNRDGNHPCIVIWTLINEDWGTRLIEDASHRAWLAGMYDWLKQADPTRLVVDNSPCHQNFHVKSDLDDYHFYRSIPERRTEWDELIADFATRPDWIWSPNGDAQRRGDEPLILSEFGVWGLPDPDLLAGPDGAEPWWMETGAAWGDGVAYPHGIQNRFATYRLDTVFQSFDAFITAVQWYQFANLKYEIEVMRRHAPIMGYVITEFTDVHWEANGLLDMNRNPRVFHDEFATINADIIIVPQVSHYAGTAGQPVRIGLSVALGGGSLPSGATLNWSLAGGDTGSLPVPAAMPCDVADLGTITPTLPAGTANRMHRVDLTLTSGLKVLARNAVDIASYAPRHRTDLPSLATDAPGLAAHARGLGYRIVPRDRADLILTHGLVAADIAAMQAGARYLVLADGTDALTTSLRLDAPDQMLLPDIILTPRDGTIWRGDWIAGFSWIRRQGPFADLPGGPLLDLSYDRVVPHHVMTGFRPWEYGGAVHAGLVVGWVHKPAALIAERRVGRGGLVATTFRLCCDPPGTDPVASALFDALTRCAAELVTDP